MRKAIGLGVLLAIVAATFSVAAFAQMEEKHSGAPPFIQIIREDVKPGTSAAHEKVEAGWPAAYKKANVKNYWLGATPVAGASEAWFLVAYDSVGQIEDVNKQVEANKAMSAEVARLSTADAQYINTARSLLLGYAPELSYRPDFNIGDYRYIMVDVYRVKPGHGEQFAAMRKAVNSVHEKANMDEHMLVYGATLGAPGGTYYVFQPLKSLKEVDAMAKSHGEGSAYYQATGDEQRTKYRDFALNDSILFERQILTINPMMSNVSETVMAASPDFWRPKMTMAKTGGEKVTPAAKKEAKQ